MTIEHIRVAIDVKDRAPQTCGVECPHLKLIPLTGGVHGCSLFDYPLKALRHYDGIPFNRESLWQRAPQCLTAIVWDHLNYPDPVLSEEDELEALLSPKPRRRKGTKT